MGRTQIGSFDLLARSWAKKMERIKTIEVMPEIKPNRTKAGNSQKDAMILESKAKAGKSPNTERESAVEATLAMTIGANALSA